MNDNFLPAQFVDRLYCLLGTPQALIGHHDFCPSDQIFCPLVSEVCFHPLSVVVDPENTTTQTKLIINKGTPKHICLLICLDGRLCSGNK